MLSGITTPLSLWIASSACRALSRSTGSWACPGGSLAAAVGMPNFFKEDQPELDAVALEERRPVQIVGESQPVGVVAVVGSCAEYPELIVGQLHAVGVVDVDKLEVGFMVESEP